MIQKRKASELIILLLVCGGGLLTAADLTATWGSDATAIHATRHHELTGFRVPETGAGTLAIETGAVTEGAEISTAHAGLIGKTTGPIVRLKLDDSRPLHAFIRLPDARHLMVIADPAPEPAPDLSQPGVISLGRLAAGKDGKKYVQDEIIAALTNLEPAGDRKGAAKRILYFPPGRYLIHPDKQLHISKQSDFTLHLAPGALIQNRFFDED